MPVYLDLASLIFSKEIIARKYKGGENQFRLDFQIETSEVNQEDDELFLIAQMNIDEFDITKLIERGLSYDSVNNYSPDFVALSRYEDSHWELDWLSGNNIFAWHIDCLEAQKTKAIHISETMTTDEILDLANQGIYVLGTIKSEG